MVDEPYKGHGKTDKPKVDPPPDEIRCRGRKRSTGERCRLAAVVGSEFCAYHGGGNRRSKGDNRRGLPKPPGSGKGAPPNNDRALSTGVATPKMPPHLEPLRQMYVERYTRAVENPDPFDIDALERAAGLQAKVAGAISDPECPASTLDTLHRILHRELRALKATREMREQTSTGTSPAEVIAAIMMKVAERRREINEVPQVEAPRPAAAMSPPTRQATVIDVDPGPAETDIADKAEPDPEPPPVETAEWEEEEPAPEPDCDDDENCDPELLEAAPAEPPGAAPPAPGDDWFPG